MATFRDLQDRRVRKGRPDHKVLTVLLVQLELKVQLDL